MSARSLFGIILNFVPRKLNPTDFNFIDPDVLAFTIICLADFIFSLKSANCFGFNDLENSSKLCGFAVALSPSANICLPTFPPKAYLLVSFESAKRAPKLTLLDESLGFKTDIFSARTSGLSP